MSMPLTRFQKSIQWYLLNYRARGGLVLLFLCTTFSCWNVVAGNLFDNCPPLPPEGGEWVDSVFFEKDGFYKLTGISDLIIDEDNTGLLYDITQNNFAVDDGLYLSGADQIGLSYFQSNCIEESTDLCRHQRRRACPSKNAVKIASSPEFLWSLDRAIKKPPDSEGLNYITFNSDDTKFQYGVNIVSYELDHRKYTYGYVLYLNKKSEKRDLNFAVFDIDDTAVLTRTKSLKNMVANCKEVNVNSFILKCAKHLYNQGYIIVYLSLRDFTLYSVTRQQLMQHGYPPGLVFLDLRKIVITWNKKPPRSTPTPNSGASQTSFPLRSHKEEVLNYLSRYGNVKVGFGDNSDDMAAYTNAKVSYRYQLIYPVNNNPIGGNVYLDYSEFSIKYEFSSSPESMVSKTTQSIGVTDGLLLWDVLKEQLFSWELPEATPAKQSDKEEPFRPRLQTR